MIPARRERFNRSFSDTRYQTFLARMRQRTGTPIEFRLCETPCFFPTELMDRLSDAALTMVGSLLDNSEYRAAADAIVPPAFRLARSETRPTFLQIDFGLVRTPAGIEGRLVELQAFPSLYAFQPVIAAEYVETWQLEGVTPFLGGITAEEYREICRRAIVGAHDPAEVVLMEVDPLRQKTLPDFALTEALWGVRAVDVRDVRRDGRALCYERDGRRIRIARVYNRVIPDDLQRQGGALAFDYRDDLDVEWTGGPDWFFRISKFSLPWLRHPWVPETHFLDELEEVPRDREHWVLKPLFSFAGGGIVFAPDDAAIAAIPPGDRRNYILQRRVAFTPVIDTPHGATQAEIRIMLIDDAGRYRPIIPLVRMGRGTMMGVDHNKGLAWVGASAGFMESP